jgi:hypothetical protein
MDRYHGRGRQPDVHASGEMHEHCYVAKGESEAGWSR